MMMMMTDDDDGGGDDDDDDGDDDDGGHVSWSVYSRDQQPLMHNTRILLIRN